VLHQRVQDGDHLEVAFFELILESFHLFRLLFERGEKLFLVLFELVLLQRVVNLDPQHLWLRRLGDEAVDLSLVDRVDDVVRLAVPDACAAAPPSRSRAARSFSRIFSWLVDIKAPRFLQSRSVHLLSGGGRSVSRAQTSEVRFPRYPVSRGS